MRNKRWLLALIGLVVAVAVSAAYVDMRNNYRILGTLFLKSTGNGLALTGGTDTAPVSTATADKNFIEFRTKTTATSGTFRTMYLKTFFDDTTPSGETGRFYSVVDTAGATDVHGIHSSVSYGTNGTCTGESAAGRFTLMVPNKVLGGTNGATYSELWADGASSDASNTQFQRYVFGGNATGVATLDGDAALFSIEGGAISSGHLVQTSTATATHAIKIRINGVNYYLLAASAP